MANPEHVARLKDGFEQWNEWRKALGVRVDLSGAHLIGAILIGADLSEARLSGARLNGARLNGAILSEADLSGAHLIGADLSGARLSGARLNGAIFSEADLSGADLSGAILSEADLSGANFIRANLSGAHLSGAHLSGADLRGARLIEAHLRGAILSGANLSGANLSGATIGWTSFGNVDLSVAEGLDTVQHDGPSTIGIDTIYRSGGNIPDVFLRGAGVPESFIVQMKAPVGAMQPIQFYSCFISYATKDQQFAERLHADLQAKGVRCWFAPHAIAGGKKIHEQIDEAIRLYDKLLLILSPHSIDSEWVRIEIANARKREKRENRRMLFPLRLVEYDALEKWQCWHADLLDLAEEIRQYFIPDFSCWKDHDSYQKGFERLLRDLKADAAKNGGE